MAAYRRAVLIYNPTAGKLRREPKRIERAAALLREHGLALELVPTTGPRTAEGLARDAVRNGADLVIAAGGDGTINEVVNGLAGTHVPMGILPGGTANVLSSEMKIGSRMERAARQLPHWTPERVSLGRIRANGEPRFFLLMAGVGLDALIIYDLSARLKAIAGKIAYWITGFSQLRRRLPEFTVEVNGREVRSSFALATRVRNYGGDFEIARTISLFADDLELVLFAGTNPAAYLLYMVGVMARKLHCLPGVTLLRSDRVSFSCPEDRRIYSQIDGEFVGPLPVEVDVVPKALTLLMPHAFREKHRGKSGKPRDPGAE